MILHRLLTPRNPLTLHLRSILTSNYLSKRDDRISAPLESEEASMFKNHRLSSSLQSLGDSSDLISRRQRPYKPTPDTRDRLFEICRKALQSDGIHLGEDDEDLLSFRLDDRRLKFNLVTSCISNFNRNVSSSCLHEMNTISDILEHFTTPVLHEDGLYSLTETGDIPLNLQIQKEPIRFDPATDTMFDGISAFPGRDTIVADVRFRRKYKSVRADKTVRTMIK